MRPIGTPVRRLAWLLVAWLVVACAPARPPLLEFDSGFSRQAAKEVFAVGYRNVSEKYLEPVEIGNLALEGLRGLGTIDPSLAVRRDGKNIVLASNDDTVGSVPAPAAGDVRGWARVTADLLAAGRRSSYAMRVASPEKLYEAVFDGVISNLDIFSRYAGAEEAKRNRSSRDGFGGIGIRFQIIGRQVRITEVMPGTPAAAGGLKTGDRIVQVGSVPVEGLRTYQIVNQLRGPVQSHVVLTILRDAAAQPLHVDLERAHIVPATVAEHHHDGVIVLAVSSFNHATATTLRAKLTAAEATLGHRLKGIVLDLRGNPGGLLKQSIEVANLFLTQGDIVNTYGRHPDSYQHYEASGDDVAAGVPLVVLVDGKSASAAEIVAAALQDRGRAVVVGTTSFGKGTVQTVIRLPNEGEITLTWSRLVTPSGYVLHGLGVFPAVCVSGSGDGDGIIAALGRHRAQVAAIIQAWHKAGFRDQKRRRTLRAACPAERRRQKVDVEVARRIIDDRALYQRALDVSRATATARY